jgi:hypothetical protein
MNLLLQILQALYFLSCIGLFVVAIIGLKQLKIAKDTAKMNAKRESLKLANSQIHHYLTKVVDLQNILDSEIEKHNIKLYKNAKAIIKGDTITVKLNSDKHELKKLESIAEPLVNTLNSMESFATFFTSKLADEKIAFKAVGKTYCGSVKTLMPDIAFHASRGHHTNILDLFLIWNNRIEQQKLREEKSSIEEKLLQIDNKPIKPLGTE